MARFHSSSETPEPVADLELASSSNKDRRYCMRLTARQSVARETMLWCRAGIATVTIEELQRREEHWVFADLIGKGRP
jgi:hypothetical protein